MKHFMYIIRGILLFLMVSNSAEANCKWQADVAADARLIHNMMPDGFVWDSSKEVIHCVSGGDYLRHKWRQSNHWFSEVIDRSPGTGSNASATVRPDGNLVVIYRDELNRRLMSAIQNGSHWTLLPVADGEQTGVWNSIVCRDDGTAFIVYNDDENNALGYCYLQPSNNWICYSLDEVNARYCSIKLHDGKPRAAYYDA